MSQHSTTYVPKSAFGKWFESRLPIAPKIAPRMPMAADSSVRIGSETKTFTVTALLQLVDDGRDWDRRLFATFLAEARRRG